MFFRLKIFGRTDSSSNPGVLLAIVITRSSHSPTFENSKFVVPEVKWYTRYSLNFESTEALL